MAFSHGSIATLELDPAGGTSYTNISVYLKEADLDIKIDASETTTFGNVSKTFVPSMDDGTFKLKGLYDPVIDSTLNSFKRQIGSFRYRPAGAGVGLPQYTGLVIMSDYMIDTNVKDAAGIEAKFQVTGTITRSTQ